MRWRLPTLVMAVLGGAPFATLRAQCTDTAGVLPAVATVGTGSDERRRIAEDVGRCSTSGALIRSSSSLTPRLPGTAPVRWAPVAPLVDATWNSTVPFSLNDGPLWAGRGLSSTIAAGFRMETDRLQISIVPQFAYEQNRLFSVLPSQPPGRSDFASPWHSGVESADLPLRFGDQPRKLIFPGNSWIELTAGPLALGASTDEQWWGPAIRNALVLSNNAGGIPQAYIRTRRPIRTRVGDIELRWQVGGLTESLYFDTVSTNNLRAMSAVVATLRVAFDTGLTVGVARSVYSPVARQGRIASHAFDVFNRWNQTAATSGPAPADSSDQLLSFFARWVLPASGLEVYGELAKLVAPGLRELFVDPQAHQGYTVGFQWADPHGRWSAFRLQGEMTSLEQPTSSYREIIPSFYTSRLVPQGYTERGQVIGAAIGPGSSSQFLAAGYFARRWRLGLELNRIRWENDAYYRTQNGVSFLAHDISLIAGLRGGVSVGGMDYDLEALKTKRLNYLFQSSVGGYAADTGFDLANTTLRLRVTPRW